MRRQDYRHCKTSMRSVPLLLFLVIAANANARRTPVFILVHPAVGVHDFAEITLRQPAAETGNPFTGSTYSNKPEKVACLTTDWLPSISCLTTLTP